MYEVGDDVVCGLYYQKKGKDSYVLLNDSYLLNCHFHLIEATKFLTSPKDHQVSENDLVHKLLEGDIFGVKGMNPNWFPLMMINVHVFQGRVLNNN